MKTAFLVTPLSKEIPQLDVDYIGIDAGAKRLMDVGYPISFVVGDFDSSDDGYLDALKDVEIIRFPVKKDETDSELAVDLCIKKGYTSIILWEGISRRLDHTLINLKLLERSKGTLVLQDTQHVCTYLGKGEHVFDSSYAHISFFPLEESVVSLQGFTYDLDHHSVSPDDLFLVSNSIPEKGICTIHSGALLCIQSNEQ